LFYPPPPSPPLRPRRGGGTSPCKGEDILILPLTKGELEGVKGEVAFDFNS